MKVLVIIVSYNFEHWIERCLGSLRGSKQPVDTLVIDNCSKDRTVDIISTHYPEVRLLRNAANLGFGQANNIGMQIAIKEGYEAVFLLNQDAWIEAEVIGTLCNVSRNHPEYGILSPVHLSGDGKKPDFGFSVYTGISQVSEASQPHQLRQVPFINAAFWMIPVPVLLAVGGFSPLFYHYGEDKDYANRIKYHRYSIGYVSGIFGCHDRENRKLPHDTIMRSEEIYLLTEYANIHYTSVRAFGYGVLAGIKKSLKCIPKGKAGDAVTYLKIAFRLLLRSREVMKYRKQSYCRKANYLSI